MRLKRGIIDKMVSWKAAFLAAVEYIVYSIAWWIVGIIMMLMGVGTVVRVPQLAKILPQPGGFVGQLILIIGVIILVLGNLASFFKVFSELLGKEFR